MRVCETLQCDNKIKVGKRCSSCRSRKTRAANLVRHLFYNLRTNAKRRGKEFGITLDEWIIFCIETNYHKLRGIMPEDYTIHRKKSEYGYFYWNIEMIRNKDNLRIEYEEKVTQFWNEVIKPVEVTSVEPVTYTDKPPF